MKFFSTPGPARQSSRLDMELAAEFTAGEGTLDLQALVEEHKRMVYRIAYSVLHNHHDAEDAAQEAFLKVWRASGKLAAVDDPKAWIARIAWNAAADRRRGRRAADMETPLEDLAREVERAHARGDSAEDIAAGSEMQRLLASLIAALPAKFRQVLELSTVGELDNAEIGRIVGLPADKVRFRLFQARQLLREKLERVLGKQS